MNISKINMDGYKTLKEGQRLIFEEGITDTL